jgi:hypothetical protein
VDRIRWDPKKMVPSVTFKAYDLSLQFLQLRKREKKGIDLGRGLPGTSPWLPFCSIIFTSFCTDYLVLSRK